MSRPLSPTGVALALLSGTTTLATLTSWSVLTEEPHHHLGPLLWLVLLVTGTGVVLRAARVPSALVPFGQLAAALVALNNRWAADESFGGWVPTMASLARARDVLGDAVDASATWAAPVPPSATDFPPLLIGAGVVVALLVDMCVCTWRAPSLAGLPLLAAFTVPWAVLDELPGSTFLLAAASFVLLLAADQALRLSGWGRTVAIGPLPSAEDASLGGHGVAGSDASAAPPGAPATRRVSLAMLLPGAVRVGAVGVALAALVPAVLPEPEGLVDRPGAGGGGTGGETVALTNPMVDIRRDLVQGPDVPLVVVESDQGMPAYLRTTVLDEFDGLAWKPAERSIPSSQRAAGVLPGPPGLSADTPQRSYGSSYTTTADFRSEWLPIPYPATRVDVPGDWRYDVATLDLITTQGASASANLQYDVTAVEVSPTPGQLVQAPAPPRDISRDGTDLPDDTPRWIRELAESVTANASSDFERAVVLQSWFRRDGGFVYSLDRGAGSDLEQLELFLGEGPGSRTGYCEQFSAAMAMMARGLGIPARVAVGFLRPDPAGPQRWVFSSRDLHAWPELYFEGAGWIRFEPTPQDRAPSVPSYTSAALPQPEQLPAPSAQPTPAAPTAEPTPDRPSETLPDSAVGGDEETSPWWLVLPVVALIVSASAVLPRALRFRSARRRASGTAGEVIDGSWREVRATALDLRLPWDDEATLRRQARTLTPHLAGSEEALLALRSLTLLVERGRYSPWAAESVDAETAERHRRVVAGALLEGAGSRARRRARWLPASLWRGGRVRSGSPSRADAGSDVETAAGSAVPSGMERVSL